MPEMSLKPYKLFDRVLNLSLMPEGILQADHANSDQYAWRA